MSEQSRRKGLRDRLIGLILLIPSAAVLTVARWLTPDPSGVGTHQQLGMARRAVRLFRRRRQALPRLGAGQRLGQGRWRRRDRGRQGKSFARPSRPDSRGDVRRPCGGQTVAGLTDRGLELAIVGARPDVLHRRHDPLQATPLVHPAATDRVEAPGYRSAIHRRVEHAGARAVGGARLLDSEAVGHRQWVC